MIRLRKLPKPQILVANEAQWTSDIVDKINAGLVPTDAEKTRYRHPQIKAALVKETHGKCAYCESKFLHVHHGDVEHIYPKSLDPSKTVIWNNLTLACEVCNQNKSNKDPLLQSIVDPYVVNPALHILFVGPMVYSRGSVPGTSTIVLLDLNRGALAERRKDQLDKIMLIVDVIMRHDVPLETRKAIYKDMVADNMIASSAYCAMAASLKQLVDFFIPEDVRN